MKRITFLAALAVTLSAAVFSSHAYADEAMSQKAVLITGTSSGIGRNATERLAAAGYLSTLVLARRRTLTNSTRSTTSWRCVWMLRSRMRSVQRLN